MSLAVLIFVALFMYGMLGHYLFGADDAENWGSITRAMTSLFILLTLGNFPNYLETGVAISPWARPYFLSYVFVVIFTVLNVLNGVVLNAMDEAREENRKPDNQGPRTDSTQKMLSVVTIHKRIYECLLSEALGF